MANVNKFLLVDSHCHLNRLDLTQYQGNVAHAIEVATQNQVGHILSVSTSMEEWSEVLALAEKFSQVSVSIGVHPSEAIAQELTVNELVLSAMQAKVIAIGETGLDYHYQFVDSAVQRERFRTHIQAAKAVKKPLIIHVRESVEDVLAILKEEQASEVGGVFHCFTETWEVAKMALDLNFMLAFSGILTFKKAFQVHDVAKRAPLDRVLLETDSPYLAPHPMRGKPNEPAFLKYTAEYFAALRGLSFDDVADQTTKNFYRLFSLC